MPNVPVVLAVGQKSRLYPDWYGYDAFECQDVLKTERTLVQQIRLEFNSNFIQDIPNPAVALIQINGYKKGKWYTIPRQVKGNIPEGKYDTSEIK